MDELTAKVLTSVGEVVGLAIIIYLTIRTVFSSSVRITEIWNTRAASRETHETKRDDLMGSISQTQENISVQLANFATQILNNSAIQQQSARILAGQGVTIEEIKSKMEILSTKEDLKKIPAAVAAEIQSKIDAKINALSETLQARLADVLKETQLSREEFKSILKQSLDAFVKEVISELKPLPPPAKPETLPTPPDETVKPGA